MSDLHEIKTPDPFSLDPFSLSPALHSEPYTLLFGWTVGVAVLANNHGTHPGAIGASGSSFWGTQGESLGHLDVIVDFAG